MSGRVEDLAPASRNRGGIWIQGAGELASGVALRLFRCGYPVVMAEVPTPRAVRRLVAFSEAVYTGRVQVEEVTGRLVSPTEASFQNQGVQVIVDPEGAEVQRLKPSVMVDARMTKKPPAPLGTAGEPVIGLGPGFRCGRDAEFIVETHRGPCLGRVLVQGEAMANTGVPGPVGGETRRRLLRSPASGRLRACRQIGDLVVEGETVGWVGEKPVWSQLSGLLRGLIHPQVELSAGEKVGDIDPRGREVDPTLVSDKALAIAGGVLEALLRCGILPPVQQ
jgi:xanthine dehydrogenase accessory factor